VWASGKRDLFTDFSKKVSSREKYQLDTLFFSVGFASEEQRALVFSQDEGSYDGGGIGTQKEEYFYSRRYQIFFWGNSNIFLVFCRKVKIYLSSKKI
jgi:hypothetical protein